MINPACAGRGDEQQGAALVGSGSFHFGESDFATSAGVEGLFVEADEDSDWVLGRLCHGGFDQRRRQDVAHVAAALLAEVLEAAQAVGAARYQRCAWRLCIAGVDFLVRFSDLGDSGPVEPGDGPSPKDIVGCSSKPGVNKARPVELLESPTRALMRKPDAGAHSSHNGGYCN